MTQARPTNLTLLASFAAGLALLWPLAPTAPGFAFIFADEANGEDVVAHPIGYSGSGGMVTLTIGIDPTSVDAAAMEIPVQNIVRTWNLQQAMTGNVKMNSANDVPSNTIDFESVAIHELGHALGLAHPNLASESGLTGDNTNYTKTTDGADDTFNVASGTDGVRGSSDDVRGDDVNLFWFRIFNNNPFTLESTVDASTYSRDLTDLPAGHLFATNPDRTVATLFGYGSHTTEAVMQQGTYTDEDQRSLGHDDVAGIRFAQSGRNESAGTSDDYTLVLEYAGQDATADIVIDFDNTKTGFAVTQTSGQFISANHIRITSADIYFNSSVNWHFNDVLLADVDLGVGIEGSPSLLVSSSNIVYTLSVTNDGPDLSPYTILSGDLDPELDYDPSGSDAGGTLSSGTVTWDLGDLAAGSSASRTLSVFARGSAGGAVTSRVAAVTRGTELNPADDQAVLTTAVQDSDSDGEGDFIDPDDDNDLMTDAYELLYSLNPLDAADASLNPDLDRHTNYQEFVADTDPGDPDSALRSELQQGSEPDVWNILFDSSANRVYSVELLEPGGTWTTAIQPEPGTGGLMTLSPTNSQPSLVYRLIVDLP